MIILLNSFKANLDSRKPENEAVIKEFVDSYQSDTEEYELVELFQSLSMLCSEMTKQVALINLGTELVSVGTMFGFMKDDAGQVAISNRIFEIWLYNLFIAEEAIDSKTYDAGQKGKDKFIKKDGLDIELILKKFVQHFTVVYGNSSETFVEENGRKLFLLYIRPLINGTGNYYIESRTRSMGRTDLIIDYQGQQYIIEMKIWHGEEYNKRGEEQLIGYLKDYHLKKGYMLSFNFNKNKCPGVKELHFKNHSIIEAVV